MNAFTTEDQETPALAMDSAGNLIVTWASQGSFGDDLGTRSIQARRFGSDGTPLDPLEFQVNTYTTDSQDAPDVASDSEGNFVAVWVSRGSSGSDDDEASIQARRFNAAGSPIDLADFQVNTYTTGHQHRPRVAMNASGDFVIVWQSPGSLGSDSSGTSIQARRFAADGAPLDPTEVQVNAFTSGDQSRPTVQMTDSGGFVVAWDSFGSLGDNWSTSIQARRFASDGQPLDPAEFQVNWQALGDQGEPTLAIDAIGRLIFVWTSSTSDGGDTSGLSIQARRFSADATPIDAAEFQVNALTSGSQIRPVVAAGGPGGFVVGWTQSGLFSDGLVRRFDSTGQPIDSVEFAIHQESSYVQRVDDLISGAADAFVVAWSSYDVPIPEGQFDVGARRFSIVLLDGFESGNSGRWSASAP